MARVQEYTANGTLREHWAVALDGATNVTETLERVLEWTARGGRLDIGGWHRDDR